MDWATKVYYTCMTGLHTTGNVTRTNVAGSNGTGSHLTGICSRATETSMRGALTSKKVNEPRINKKKPKVVPPPTLASMTTHSGHLCQVTQCPDFDYTLMLNASFHGGVLARCNSYFCIPLCAHLQLHISLHLCKCQSFIITHFCRCKPFPASTRSWPSPDHLGFQIIPHMDDYQNHYHIRHSTFGLSGTRLPHTAILYKSSHFIIGASHLFYVFQTLFIKHYKLYPQLLL